MVTFRKSLLLLAVIAMMVPAANAQILGVPTPFQCVASAGVPPLVRAEGLAELTGDVLLTCTGGTPTPLAAPVPQINFRVFLNTNVTSRLLDGSWNEALLMIDDPSPGAQRLCPDLDGCGLTGIGAEPGVDYETAEYNVWQGTYVVGNTGGDGNTIEWLGVPIDPPGTQIVRTIRITNIRANAAMKGVGGGLIPSDLILFISATGPSSFPINNPQQTVAFVQDGLTFSATDGDFLQCEDPEGDSDNPMTLTYSERFATAFKRRNAATTPASPTSLMNQNTPGSIYNTETGFYNSSFSSHGAGEAGLASQGTRVIALFKGIPSGVKLFVGQRNEAHIAPADSTTDACVSATDDACWTQSAVWVSGASSTGAGGTANTWASTLDGGAIDEAEVTLDGGSGSVTWEVTGDNPLANNTLSFFVRVDYTPNTTAGVPALGSGSVAGSYAPISDIVTATSTDLQPRFIDDSTDVDHITINSCATNLLWPFVSNQAGFDTGLVISNTSRDPFGTATQEGPCEIYYYGNSNGSDPPAMDTTPSVGAGGYAVWLLSSGGGVKPWGGELTGVIAAAPGFEGYVIAHCQFQYAHGYGFISDLGAQKLAQGYLALILDDSISGSRTGSVSEPLNQ